MSYKEERNAEDVRKSLISFLEKNAVSFDDVKVYYNDIFDVWEVCIVGVEGDWKHDHLRLNYLIASSFFDIPLLFDGEVPEEAEVTEDYYRSDHYYRF